ncbi:hypothetical protein BDW67DRAFT_155186 [Aspergillus spinulosporus]
MKQATTIDIECLSLIRSMRFVNQARTHGASFTNSTPYECRRYTLVNNESRCA